MSSKIKATVDSESNSKVNRRLASRKDCRIYASIRLNGVLICDCVIKDISETGMRLYTAPGNWLPHKFEIHAPGFVTSVSVIKEWSTNEYAGVSFIGN